MKDREKAKFVDKKYIYIGHLTIENEENRKTTIHRKLCQFTN